tara:strand:- start:118 stop:909 length:792 start_codon:yes stop_codon:yes gene_type:complete
MLNNNLINQIQKKIILNNKPFPNIVLENSLPLEIIKEAENDFKSFRKFNSGDKNFRYGTPKFNYSTFNEMPKSIKNIISFLYSKNFLKLLERNFNLKNILPDWTLYGGGMHNSVKGNFLTIHSDFIYRRKINTRRVINLLLYLNSDWEDEWKGHIELWDKKMTKKISSLSPSLNNMLIFRTDKDSNHGFPDKLLCPENIARKSIALYYYVEEKNTLPFQIKKRKYYQTVWKKRPNTEDPEFMDRDNLWRKIKYKYLPRFFLKF